jgi:hypothetical protein
MRFFSNEAKENADDEPVAENDRDRAPSDGATVPHQRIGSPWTDTSGPGTGSDLSDVTDPADRNGTDDTLRRDDSEVRHDGDDLVRDSDGPRTAGESPTEDELDLPLDGQEDRSGTDGFRPGSHRAEGDVDTAAEDSVDTAPADSPAEGSPDSPVESSLDSPAEGSETEDRVDTADGPVDEEPGAEQQDGTTTTYGPDGSVTTVDTSTDDSVDSDQVDETEPVALGTADRTEEERDLDEATPVTATAPVETTPADATDTDSPTTDSAVADSAVPDSAVADSTTADSAVAGSAPVEDTAADADAAPAVAAVPVGAADAATTEAAKPNLAASPVGDKLFIDGDSFNDRLRDVALHFVDDPKEATEQAGALVDEAIDQVTSALQAQKDALAGEGDDTEKLRIQLRGYRDILKRLTAL